MQKNLNWILMTIAFVLAWGSAGPAAVPPADKPDDPRFVYLQSVFPCTSRQTFTLDPGFSLSLADSTTGTGVINGYSCRSWPETGPEAIYDLVVGQDVEFFAALRNLGDRDLDLFLLSDCNTDSCLVGVNIEFSTPVRLSPGNYILVVDGYFYPTPQAGPFTLVMSCREPGLPAGICAGTASQAVFCGAETSTHTGDLFLLPNLVQASGCSPVLERAGDAWYAVTLAAYHEFTARMTAVGPQMDAALWLFADCGPDAPCLAFVDDKLAGQAESLTWVNPSFEETTVYLGVDAFTLPGAEGEGAFTLEIRGQGMVPTETSPLGSVRSLFR